MIGTATWQRPLQAILEWEQRLASKAGRNPVTTSVYEFIRFGIKQGWACLFGGLMLALLLATHRWYPNDAPLSRYDFLTSAAIVIQIGMLLTGLETWEEAKVMLLFHLAGTLMEVFKTAIGSWTYPEPSLLHLYGVPLFTGFMYASVGSYIARVWRAFDFRFIDHPSLRSIQILAAATYIKLLRASLAAGYPARFICRSRPPLPPHLDLLSHLADAPPHASAAGLSLGHLVHLVCREHRYLLPDLPAEIWIAFEWSFLLTSPRLGRSRMR